jgi:hypothetical protein
MKRRRYTQYNKLFAVPLVAPDDFEQNISEYTDINIVRKFDECPNEYKKYAYTIHNEILAYWNSETTINNPYKAANTHRLPLFEGDAYIGETLSSGEKIEKIISSSGENR